MKIRKITEREKAIIFWAVVTDQKNTTEIYKLTRDDQGKNLADPAAQANRWRRLEIIDNEFKLASFQFDQMKKTWYDESIKNYLLQVRNARTKQNQNQDGNGMNENRNGAGEGETTNNAVFNAESLVIDFTDRNQFLEYLNRQANTITDDKQRNDLLKMLSDLLRFKDDKPGENGEIQRFYIPMTCKNCLLYQKEQQNQTEY